MKTGNKFVNWFKNLSIVKKVLAVIAALFIGLTALSGVVAVADPEGFAQAQEETRQAQAEREAQADARKAQKAEDDRRKAEEEQARKDAEQAQKDAEASQKAQEAAQRQADEEQAQKDAEAAKKAEEQAQAQSEAQAAEKPVEGNGDALADLAKATGVDGAQAEWSGDGSEGGFLKITFPVQDNLTNNMIRVGAQKDTMSILRAVKESNIEYKRVFVHGTFPMVDKFGNETEGTPLVAQYIPETVNKINYDEILVQEEIWNLADMHKADPELFTK